MAELLIKGKCPGMIARLPKELARAYLAEEGVKISFGHYVVSPLVSLTVSFWRELAQINRRDRGSWVWSEKHLHQLAYYLTTTYYDTVATAVKKMARVLRELQVKKIVVKWNVAEARLLYRLLAMFG